jgi:hypothetical protein
MNKPLTWSFSSLNAFETCPRRYYLTKVSKEVVEKQTAATMHGNAVHKALELDLNGEQALPKKYADYAPMMKRIKMTKGNKLAEQKLGLTRDFKPTAFFAKDVWLRSVLDVTIVQPTRAIVLDYKTGKPKTDIDQLKLFAGVAFQVYPRIETVDAGYIWLGHDKLDKQTFHRDEAPIIWQDFTRRVARIEHAVSSGDFPPKPSGLCREWCPVGRNLCEFCGDN